MHIIEIAPFYVIGISIRTTNENGRAAIDIPMLWQRFFAENILKQIPGKEGTDLYCVYTGYEKDHTRPYTTLLGCRVNNLSQIPEGLTGKAIAGGPYTTFIAKGDLDKGAVGKSWQQIWQSSISRAYTADFEVYGAKAKDMQHAEVDIYIALKS